MKIIQQATGSGTSEYAIDDSGRLLARGYGERHGHTFGGAARMRASYSPWRLVCESAHWAVDAAGVGISLHAYEQARLRGLDHDSALSQARNLSEL